MPHKRILAGDIGGSHISIALIEETSSGMKILTSSRTNVDSSGSKEEILTLWSKVLEPLVNSNPEILIGLAMPAPFDYKNGVCWIKDQGKFLSLYGVNLKQELANRLSISSENLFFVNDAEAFLRGEAYCGKAQGYQNVLGLTLGSGLGSSFKFGEEFSDGALWSKSFKEGIAEDYLGTGWFLNKGEAIFGEKLSGVKELVETLPKDEVKSIFKEYAANLAVFLWESNQKYELNHVVFGGNICKASFLFEEELKLELQKLGSNLSFDFSELGEMSALYGVISSLAEEDNELVNP